MFELSGNMAEAFASVQDKNTLLMLVGFPFLVTLLVFWWLINSLHKRTVDSVVTGAKSFRWNQFWFAFAVCSAFMIVTTAFSYFMDPDSFILQFNLKKFAILVVVAMVFLTIQTITEEVIFRGYLTQGFGLLTKSRLFALVLPALLFGAMHLGNPEVVEHGVAKMFPLYFLMGLTFGIMTLMNDGTELAMGYHAANNIMISLIMTSPEAVLQTDSIFRTTQVANVDQQMYSLIIFEVIVLAVFAWKYKWKNWGQKLLGPIKLNHEPVL